MVTIRYINVGEFSDDVCKELYAALPKVRRDKVDAYRFDKDKRLSLGAGYLLAMALKEIGKTEADVRYDRNEKPFLPDFYFNLSHSGDIACIATADGEVGVDVEKIAEERTRAFDHVFSDAERLDYLTGEHAERTKNMFLLWTVKEAFVKMKGVGLLVDISDVEYSRRPYGIKYLGRLQNNVYVEEYELPGYKISVCSRDDCFAPRLEKATYAPLPR